MKNITLLTVLLFSLNFAYSQSWQSQGWNVTPQTAGSTDTSLWLINANGSLENKSINGKSKFLAGDNLFGFGLKGSGSFHYGLNPANIAFNITGDFSAINPLDTLIWRGGINMNASGIASQFETKPYEAQMRYRSPNSNNYFTLDDNGITGTTDKDLSFSAENTNFNATATYSNSASNVSINAISNNVEINAFSDIVLDAGTGSSFGNVLTDDDIYITDTNKGLVLVDSNGVKWRLQVSTTGNLTTTVIP